MSLSKPFFGLLLLAVTLFVPSSPAQALPNVPNFHQVNEHVFRGGQPSNEAWPSIAGLGVKVVIDLRRPDEHSTDAEARAVTAAGMKYYNFPMKGAFTIPSDEQITKILALFDSPEPVFIHCKRGADRTGAVIACYRVAHDRWDRKQALHEAKSFGMSWTQVGLKRYVMAFQPKTVSTASAGLPSDK